MSDLLKKLNILIQAGINDVMDEAQRSVSEPLKNIPSVRLGKGIKNEVGQLRAKVNDALAYEDELIARLDKLQQEIDDLDRQADEAVVAGNDVQARYLVDRLTRAQQRYTMTEADLKAHRLAAQELMRRVNELDAAISDARHAEQQQAPTPPDEPAETEVVVRVEAGSAETKEGEAALERMQAMNQQAGKMISDVLREARQKIDQMDDLLAAEDAVQSEVQTSVQDEVNESIAESAIDDDIARRRARLAAPPKQPPKSDGDK